MSDDDKKEDATRVGGGPPAAPKLPTAAPPSAPKSSGGSPVAGTVADPTHLGSAPPQLPKPGPPPPSVQKPAAVPPAPPAEPADDEGEETVAIGPVAQRTPFSLQRVQPPGRTGIIYLTGDTYLMGRKQGADLPLFSPTASREHARLERRSDGWYLAPVEGKPVIANGNPVRAALRLEHKMRLQIGGDELIFFDARPVVAASTPARAPAALAGRSRRALWIVVAAVLVALAAAFVWLLHSPRG